MSVTRAWQWPTSAVASEINSGGVLERKFKMIISDKPSRSNSRWLQVCVLLCAVVVFPLGVRWVAAEEDRATDWNQNCMLTAFANCIF
jgi:hypothetical protein